MDNLMKVGGFIRMLSNGLSREMGRYSESLGLTPVQGLFLHHIWYRQEMQRIPTYAKDLEQAFTIKHPTVSGILQRMEASGFVELIPDQQDRRCKSIRLTPKSLEAHAQTAEHIRQVEEQLTQGMTLLEVEQLQLLLQKAADNLGCHPCNRYSKDPKEETIP